MAFISYAFVENLAGILETQFPILSKKDPIIQIPIGKNMTYFLWKPE